LAAMAIIGGLSLPLYSIAAAYMSDWVEPEYMSAASSQMVMLYGVGALAGPMVVGIGMGVRWQKDPGLRIPVERGAFIVDEGHHGGACHEDRPQRERCELIKPFVAPNVRHAAELAGHPRLRTVRCSMRFSYRSPWKMRCTKMPGVCT